MLHKSVWKKKKGEKMNENKSMEIRTCKMWERFFDDGVSDLQLEINDSISISLCFCTFLEWFFIESIPSHCFVFCSCHSVLVMLKTISFKLYRRWFFFSFFFLLLCSSFSFSICLSEKFHSSYCLNVCVASFFCFFFSFLRRPLFTCPFGTFDQNEQTDWRDVYSHLQCNIEKI